MKENKNKQYCTPEVEVLDVRVEKGFAGSPGGSQPDEDQSVTTPGGFNAGDGTGWSSGNTDDWWS